MEIVLLGTGAALPTRQRWPSATALIRPGEILLFDCGEGAQIQFQQAQLKPGKLSKIFISHFHGDHFYGLIGLLTSLQMQSREKPLHLYGPHGLNAYLEFMKKLSHFTFGFKIMVQEVRNLSEKKVWEFENYRVTARPLHHRITSLGFRLEESPKSGRFLVGKAESLGIPEGPLRGKLQKGETVVLPNGTKVEPSQVLGPERPGKKVAICLDTKPCANAIHLAKDADVLIHDGSFDDSKRDWAETTGHSTVVQAAEIAREAGAKQLVLTHISARYKEEDEPELLEQAQRVFPNTILGHDLERIAIES
ncbi:ribonuclease Z [candidate division KSB1 bacterium]|nr:ribonuclease Z [candidate division KSB1 bacterium]NIR73380.1 ribonuclease Z [candidate division KSB1 bacterium]NIS25255.1 ribonuclease Z [candidate division KSB1 bacterium]NIT72158.1 ribonuclease Z [candidate division KSB1 bacterium]NIU25964.1 ribonuclease Z [candidate division KSB1 bacterium]